MGKYLGSVLLVGGTTIGGGILALPLQTYTSGFMPVFAALFTTWFFMLMSSLALLEVNLYFKGETNYITLVQETLGNHWKCIAWIVYVSLLLALMSAYLLAISSWVVKILESMGFKFSRYFSIFISAFILMSLVYKGKSYIDYINKILSMFLVLGYCVIVKSSIPYIETTNLFLNNGYNIIYVLPLLVTSFGFSIIVPSISSYLDYDHKKISKSIIIGSAIPLVVYIIWEAVTLGVISQGILFSISNTQGGGTEISYALEEITNNSLLLTSAKIFSICAIVTSLFGVTLSLFDFYIDGFKMTQNSFNKIKVLCLTFVPPVLIVIFFPNSFVTILSFGGIFVSILLGVIPMMMLSSLRKNFIVKYEWRSPVNNFLIKLSLLFFILVIFIEVYNAF